MKDMAAFPTNFSFDYVNVLDDRLDLVRKNEHDGGFDVRTPRLIVLRPGQITTVDTGIIVSMNRLVGKTPILKVHARSGLGSKYGLTLRNDVPIVDYGYKSYEDRHTIKLTLVRDLAKERVIASVATASRLSKEDVRELKEDMVSQHGSENQHYYLTEAVTNPLDRHGGYVYSLVQFIDQRPLILQKGERFAQFVFENTDSVQGVQISNEDSDLSSRFAPTSRKGGLGSTGVK